MAYETRISTQYPGCVLILLNMSNSLLDTNFRIIDNLLDALIWRSYTGELFRTRFYVGIFGYIIDKAGEVTFYKLLTSGQEETHLLYPLNPKEPLFQPNLKQRVSSRPKIEYTIILKLLKLWSQHNDHSFPPIVVNLTDRSSSSIVPKLKSMQMTGTQDGPTLVFNCELAKVDLDSLNSGFVLELLFRDSNLLPNPLISEIPKETWSILKGEHQPPVMLNHNAVSVDTQVGNYRIVEIIGTGGIGTVYKARHKVMNSIAAIKIHEFFPRDEIVGIAFLQAANYLSQLDHPNIVSLYDYGFHSGYAFMVMEFVVGCTLTDLIPENQTEEWTARAINIFFHILSAVRYSHNCIYLNMAGRKVRGVIHGDIKPQNILIQNGSGVSKLTDFMVPDVHAYLGREELDVKKLLAPYNKPLTREALQELTESMMVADTRAFGTPRYMSPEQWGGRVSPKTDIFSLGATLYEMMTSHPPVSLFKGIKPKAINPYVPNWVEEVICTAMKLDPSERYQSVAVMESLFRENLLKEKNQTIVFSIKEWIMGDKTEIKTGDISNIEGQLFIGKFNDVFANLNNNGQNELAEALKTLKEAIMASAVIDLEKKQEHIEVINQIGEEANKDKPNKTLLKVLSDGLLSMLKSIPDIAKAVAAVAPLLTTLTK